MQWRIPKVDDRVKSDKLDAFGNPIVASVRFSSARTPDGKGNYVFFQDGRLQTGGATTGTDFSRPYCQLFLDREVNDLKLPGDVTVDVAVTSTRFGYRCDQKKQSHLISETLKKSPVNVDSDRNKYQFVIDPPNCFSAPFSERKNTAVVEKNGDRRIYAPTGEIIHFRGPFANTLPLSEVPPGAYHSKDPCVDLVNRCQSNALIKKDGAWVDNPYDGYSEDVPANGVEFAFDDRQLPRSRRTCT